MRLDLHICDVFAPRPLAGNSLSVVLHDEPLDVRFMQELTRELRQFETVFLRPGGAPDVFEARVFDLNRELDFAGHPLLGAAAVLHAVNSEAAARRTWRLRVRGRDVPLASQREERDGFLVTMDQGSPEFLRTASAAEAREALSAFSLSADDAIEGASPQVVSTGLRYLVVPVRSGLSRAAVQHPDLEQLLDQLGAEFAYLVDVEERAGRHWENDGSLEDIATGSAAGVVGAFLVRHGFARPDERIVLRQGDFVGRPSALHVTVHGARGAIERVELSGPVAMVAHGSLRSGIVTG